MSNTKKVFSSIFCMSPWTNVDISPTGDVAPCCKMTQKPNDTAHISSGLSAYYSSAFLQRIKQTFERGEFPPECIRCQREEATGVTSKRLMDAERWGDAYDRHDLRNAAPVTISLSLGNSCNLKCRVCSSYSSSAWYKDTVRLLPERAAFKPTKFYTLPNFMSELLLALDSIEHIDIAGGEPFFAGVDQQIIILDSLINARQAPLITIHYTTNGTIMPTPQLLQRLREFKRVEFQISLDGVGAHFEYNRYPAQWSPVYRNLKEMQEIASESHNFEINIAHNLSIFTGLYYKDFLSWSVAEGIASPWAGLLTRPEHYSIGIVPANNKHIMSAALAGTEFESTAYDLDHSQLLPEFWQVTALLDQDRKTSFKNVFPETFDILQEP